MKVIKFNLADYVGKNVAIHCPQHWQSELFCNFLHNAGKRWRSGQTYERIDHWFHYKEYTVYYFNSGTYGYLGELLDEPCTVLDISEFIYDEMEVC